MPLVPKRVKHRREFRGKMRGAAKGVGVRMGSGKGAPAGWVAVVKREKIMFEIGGVSEETAREAMRLAASKLPIKCKFVKREDQEAGGATNED